MTVEREMPPQSCCTSSTGYFARLRSRFGLICSWFDVFVSIVHSLKAMYVTFWKHVTMRASLGVDFSVSVLRFLLVVLDVRRVRSNSIMIFWSSNSSASLLQNSLLPKVVAPRTPFPKNGRELTSFLLLVLHRPAQ